MSLAKKDLVEVLRLYKLPIQETLTRKQKILRLYKKCLITAMRIGSTKRSRALMMGPPTNPFYIFTEKRFGWDSPSHPAAIVHELFTQRKVETDPVLSDIYVKEAEQFVLQHSRADPVPYKFNSVNHPLYDRYRPIPKTFLDPNACVDFEEYNKMETESDYYIRRYNTEKEMEEIQKLEK